MATFSEKKQKQKACIWKDVFLSNQDQDDQNHLCGSPFGGKVRVLDLVSGMSIAPKNWNANLRKDE